MWFPIIARFQAAKAAQSLPVAAGQAHQSRCKVPSLTRFSLEECAHIAASLDVPFRDLA